MWVRILLLLSVASIIEESKGLTCFRCERAKSHRECDRRGRLERCKGKWDACETEIRAITFKKRLLITKGCKQRTACMNKINLEHCDSIGPNTMCSCCCDGDRCNSGNTSCGVDAEGSSKLSKGNTRRGSTVNKVTGTLSLHKQSRVISRDRSQHTFCTPPVNAPTFGRVRCDNNNYIGSMCTFSCVENYARVDGPSRITCRANGLWSSLPPTCRRITCPTRHHRLNNGVVMCTNSNEVKSVCRFSCNSGYRRLGIKISACILDANSPTLAGWSNSAPRCIKRCPPPKIGNGRARCNDGNIEGSDCKFRCSRYHRLIGFETSSCVVNRFGKALWSQPMPVCEKLECPKLNSIVHGSWNCTEDKKVNSKCTYKCDMNYRPTPFRPLTTTCQTDQTWTETVPCCSEPCPDNPNIDLVFALDSSSSLGTTSWNVMIGFIQTLIGLYDQVENGTRVSVYRYNRVVDKENIVSFDYGRQFGKEALLERVGNIPYNGFGTKTGLALEFATESIFVPENGYREDSRGVFIVLTDGKSTDEVAIHAEKLREHGILTYAIAVRGWRGRLDMGQLNDIAGTKQHLFVLNEGFKSLTAEFAKRIAVSVCYDPCFDI